jgi:hypothetical protein
VEPTKTAFGDGLGETITFSVVEPFDLADGRGTTIAK